MKHVFIFLAIFLALTTLANAQVVSVSPAQNALNIKPDTTIQITFSEAMMTSSFNDTASFLVYGRTSGRHRGAIAFLSQILYSLLNTKGENLKVTTMQPPPTVNEAPESMMFIYTVDMVKDALKAQSIY